MTTLRRPGPPADATPPRRHAAADRAATPPAIAEEPRDVTASPPVEDRLWGLVLDARRADPETRDAFQRAVSALPGIDGSLVLVTCHRVEVYGRDPELAVHALAAGPAELLRGGSAARHLLRVAAGLESAVVGEDQVLSQLRTAARTLAGAGHRDAVVDRLAQSALGVGRRVRRGGRPHEHGLAGRALRRATPSDGPLRRLLVVGAGQMGMAVAMAASRAGIDLTVATRRPRRLLDGIPVVGLVDAAALAPGMDAIVVALPAPWPELAGAEIERLPVVVDLSSPAAVPPAIRDRLVGRFVGIDDLFETPAPADAARAQRTPTSEPAQRYAERAEAEVARAEREFATWLAARPAATSAERLVARARRRSDRRVERTLRRLPGLDERGRELVRQLADQLAADLLHEPLAHLRADADGSARAAARDLFDL